MVFAISFQKQPVSYSLLINPSSLFSIRQETGEISLTRTLDYESDQRRYLLMVRASEEPGSLSSATEVSLIRAWYRCKTWLTYEFLCTRVNLAQSGGPLWCFIIVAVTQAFTFAAEFNWNKKKINKKNLPCCRHFLPRVLPLDFSQSSQTDQFSPQCYAAGIGWQGCINGNDLVSALTYWHHTTWQ